MRVCDLRPMVVHCQPFGRDRLRYVPIAGGCYVLTTLAGDILYIGLSKNLRVRMEQHLDTPGKIAPTAHGRAVQFYWLQTDDFQAVERGWLNSHLLATGALPVLNKVASPISG